VIHGMGARFQAIDRNKLSVTLELKNDKDRDELKSLVAEADVFVHNMLLGWSNRSDCRGRKRSR
jgi:crotonobetainyl-CoA:carnitine CoA-transferase CaiB-like acyl-CoA transferase